ncbi:MAG: hypothetical protein N4A49_00125 [Marinifilaceae bacterium]|jgi:hypothetical protein|nr:hypothetical protein [Marinifilaceae bacterium]
MKKHIYTLLACISMFCACGNEENTSVDKSKDQRYIEMTKDDPSDPIQHQIHEFYKNTGVVIVKNPEIADYKYNFSERNAIDIVPPEQTQEILQAALDLFNETIVKYYVKEKDGVKDYSFFKKNFPLTLQFANKIKFEGAKETDPTLNVFVSKGIFVMGNINESILTLTDKQKELIMHEYHLALWSTYLTDYNKIIISPAFYRVSEDFVDTDAAGTISFDWYIEDENALPYGMRIADEYWDDYEAIYYTRGFFLPDPDPVRRVMLSFEGIPFNYPKAGPAEFADVLIAMLTKDADQVKALVEKYPLLKQKYDLFVPMVKEQLGFEF